ncbi:MAG: TIGR04255 family protein [Mesorhizobium sp.]
MGFEPKSKTHAIVEVVFGLRFAKPFEAQLLEKVVASHDEWRDQFPRVTRGVGFQFHLGQEPVLGLPLPPASVAFERLRPDGTADWKLRLEGDRVLLNCLDYSRWSEIWPAASRYLFKVAWLATNGDNPVVAALLQYVDVFEWTGDRNSYDAAELLKKGAAIPATILNKGPFWHLHQGWFRSEPRLPASRLLERVHLDAVEDDRTKRPIVRLDTYLDVTLDAPMVLVGMGQTENAALASLFSVLHDLDKELMLSVLSTKAAKRIKLNV